jgi:hypothetical protein
MKKEILKIILNKIFNNRNHNRLALNSSIKKKLLILGVVAGLMLVSFIGIGTYLVYQVGQRLITGVSESQKIESLLTSGQAHSEGLLSSLTQQKCWSQIQSMTQLSSWIQVPLAATFNQLLNSCLRDAPAELKKSPAEPTTENEWETSI